MDDEIKCSFCGKVLNNETERVISGEFDEEISEGFAGGRVDLPDIILCGECYQTKILDQIKK